MQSCLKPMQELENALMYTSHNNYSNLKIYKANYDLLRILPGGIENKP